MSDQNPPATALISALGLVQHPEGGWYRETYRSANSMPGDALPECFDGPRSLCTAIYFLLEQGDCSALHRIKSDELWFFHGGASLTIHLLTADGVYSAIRLGAGIAAGEVFQAMVPAGTWFGAEMSGVGEYSLVSCTVAPGFDFADFEMGVKPLLLQQYPDHAALINRLTR
ncbi:MAG: cupin domain-containing protein [Trichlorobacter sp.]|uniref:cupin domain-containing protein n=1 Tax=Trichlorobacter sp. TaxID=2911007 RepID=UPI00256C68E2|nr:cupin domain-containing protein [Trichlorobacter sp.]MDK9717858.1 cupin domain-containing protein [Trichlorobacter sp.]